MNLKPETRNPKPETRNPEPESLIQIEGGGADGSLLTPTIASPFGNGVHPDTRNPKPGTRNLKPGSRNPKPGTLCFLFCPQGGYIFRV